MAKQTKAQAKTVERVMHKFKDGELEQGRSGRKVRNPKQAIAIALSEAGASNRPAPAKAGRRSVRSEPTAGRRSGRDATSKAALYAEARKRDIPGRSTMSKAELERALAR